MYPVKTRQDVGFFCEDFRGSTRLRRQSTISL